MYELVVGKTAEAARNIRADMIVKHGSLVGQEEEACDRLIKDLESRGIKADKLYGWMLLDNYTGWRGSPYIERAYVNLHYGRCRSYVDITADFYKQWLYGPAISDVIIQSGRPRWFRQMKPSRVQVLRKGAAV